MHNRTDLSVVVLNNNFILAHHADTVLFEKLCRYTVPICQRFGKRTVINSARSARGAFFFQYCKTATEKLRKTERLLRASPVIFRDVHPVRAHDLSVRLNFGRNSRRGQSTHDLGTDWNQMIVFLQFFNHRRRQRLSATVISAGNTEQTRADQYIFHISPHSNQKIFSFDFLFFFS